MITAKMVGIKAVIKSFKKETEAYDKASAAATYQMALELIARSKAMCPVDKGTLIGSSYVRPPFKYMGSWASEVGYAAFYAWYVHERTEATNWTRPGSGPKYLEKPYKDIMRGYEKRVANKARKNKQLNVGPGQVKTTERKRPVGR